MEGPSFGNPSAGKTMGLGFVLKIKQALGNIDIK